MENIRWQRKVAEEPQSTRTPTQVDRDRILYARSFARLAEVTQVISADNGYVFHNRLTHSLKVSQLSRRIAERLETENTKKKLKDRVDFNQYGGLDIDAAEAAGLAHDLGHPPFGHIAEEEINDRMTSYGEVEEGFEGNAQSFRLVTRLSVSDANPSAEGVSTADLGLNLTRATLNGVLKYPWLFGKGPKPKKWGAYDTEQKFLKFAREKFDFSEHTQSLEAGIMDISDDITYATHDVIDFYCAGKIPLDQLQSKSAELQSFFTDVFKRNEGNKYFKKRKQMEERFIQNISVFDASTRYTGSTLQDVNLWQGLTSLIGDFVRQVELKPIEKGKALVDFTTDEVREDIEMLKQLTWHYVILNTDLAIVQFGQRRMIATLFDVFYEAACLGQKKNSEWKLFPIRFEHSLKDASTDQERARITADYISSLTEREVEVLYSRIKDRRRPVVQKKENPSKPIIS